MGAALVALSILVGILATANPIVVERQDGLKTYLQGKREKQTISDSDIESFVEMWIRARYEWSSYEPDHVAKAIAPVSSDGLQEKVRSQMAKGAAGACKGQTVEQTVSGVKVKASENEISATFDRVIRINGIPIVVPLEVTLEVIKGRSTRWNPIGLYVNGVTERGDK